MISVSSISQNPIKQFRNYAAAMGLPNSATRSTQDLTEDMRKVDVMKVLNASSEIFLKEQHSVPYKFCIEGRWPGALIQEDPQEVWKKGTYRHRSWMMGVVANEGTIGIELIKNETLLKEFNENLEENLANLLEVDVKRIPAVREFYLGNSEQVDETNKISFLKVRISLFFTYSRLKV